MNDDVLVGLDGSYEVAPAYASHPTMQAWITRRHRAAHRADDPRMISRVVTRTVAVLSSELDRGGTRQWR